MKKFQSLGRSLSKAEMKNVLGGMDILAFDDGSGGTPCTVNGDCSNGTLTCPGGGTAPGTGVCDKTRGQCRLVGVCA